MSLCMWHLFKRKHIEFDQRHLHFVQPIFIQWFSLCHCNSKAKQHNCCLLSGESIWRKREWRYSQRWVQWMKKKKKPKKKQPAKWDRMQVVKCILYSKLKFKSCPIEKFSLFSQFSFLRVEFYFFPFQLLRENTLSRLFKMTVVRLMRKCHSYRKTNKDVNCWDVIGICG